MTLAGGTIVSLVMIGAGTLTAFFVQLLLAKQLGTEGYGFYGYVNGWLNIAVIAANFQYDVCAIRYVAEYTATGARGLLRGFVGATRHIIARNSLVLACIVALGLIAFRERVWRGEVVAALLGCALLPLSSRAAYNVCALQGIRRVTVTQFSTQLLRPLAFGLGLVAVIWGMGARITPAIAIALNGTALLLSFVVMERAFSRYVKPFIGDAVPEARLSEWTKTARGFMLIALAQFIVSQQSDVLVAGTLLGSAAAGIYNAASQASAFIAMAVGAVSFLGAPMITAAHSSGDRVQLQRVVRRFGRLNLLLATPIALALLVGGKVVLRLYGADFVAGYPALVILIAVQVLTAGFGTQGGFLLTMTGRERVAGRILALSAAANLALTLVLTPQFGLVGTASATLLATAGRVAALYYVARREMGVSLLP